jgi:bis(5'-nucleosyl)-tetraphosphatase (symmetrical)
MATYAIGDIQGCYAQFENLLQSLDYDPARDVLWSVGDLVNRGPHSLEVLRFFYRLGDRAQVVLGNHDLHLLAVAYGNKKHYKPGDTIASVLEAPDRGELLDWLRHRKLLHRDPALDFTMIHAGLPPQWDLAQASACAAEVEAVLQGPRADKYFSREMFGDTPKRWSDDLSGWERIRFITGCFTRLRYCDRDGGLLLKSKHAPGQGTADDHPWFLHPRRASRDTRIVFGHWSTLGYYAGNNVYALDTGCLWGGELTALRLEDCQVFHCPCPQSRNPQEEM